MTDGNKVFCPPTYEVTAERVAESLEGNRYRFAKTMQWCPHWYTLREFWRGPLPFEAVVQFIRDHGYQEQFHSKTFTRYNVGDYKYWTMGAPLAETILINRAFIVERPVDKLGNVLPKE